MADADISIVKVYDEHYSSKDEVQKEWTKLCSYMRLTNTLKLIKDRKFTSVLDVGAGDGMVLQRLSESGSFSRLNAVEVSESAVGVIQSLPISSLGEIKKFDGYNIPFDSDYFDLATCYHVIEHVEHPRILLREIARVSRYQVFEIPLDYRLNVDTKLSHLMSYGHIAIFTPSLFRFLLKSEGFEILDDYASDISWEAQKFMILQSKKDDNKMMRLFKSHLSNLKKKIKRAFSSNQFNKEFSYSTYTCFCKFSEKPNIEYNQVDLW